MVVAPTDDPAKVAAALRSGGVCGLKVYHCYSARPDTMNAGVEEFAPEWMWELLNETRGVLMLPVRSWGRLQAACSRSHCGIRLKPDPRM